MSTPNNSTPFFGCKISLISKSEIRYEGILYTIDPKESTIALAKVKSFGSEDRPVERPVPPRDEIFEFIIFRASDIKDLIVDDPPSTGLGDPAIIQAHSTSTSFPSSFPQPSSINASQTGSLQQHLQRAGVPPARTASESVSVIAPDSTKAKPSTSAASVAIPQPVKSVNATTSANNANKQPARNHFNSQQQQPQVKQLNRGTSDTGNNNTNVRSNTNFVQKRNNNQNGRPRNEENNYNQRNGHQNYRSFNRNFNQNRLPMGYNRRLNTTNRNYVMKPGQKTFNQTPIPEFDFEKAENEFKILEEKMSNMKVNGTESGGDDVEDSTAGAATTTTEEDPSKEHHYNKAKSFFDTISCEAIEREKGNVQRVDWKAERKLNRETFGVVGTRRPNYRPNNRGGFNGVYRSYHNQNSNYRNRNSQQQHGGYNRPQVNRTPGSTQASTTTASAVVASTSTSPAAASTSQPLVSPAKN